LAPPPPPFFLGGGGGAPYILTPPPLYRGAPFRFLNSGMWMGAVGAAAELLETMAGVRRGDKLPMLLDTYLNWDSALDQNRKQNRPTPRVRYCYARRMGQPTQRATNYTAKSNIETAQIILHANGQSAPRSGGACDVCRGAGSHTPSTASESFCSTDSTRSTHLTLTQGHRWKETEKGL